MRVHAGEGRGGGGYDQTVHNYGQSVRIILVLLHQECSLKLFLTFLWFLFSLFFFFFFLIFLYDC